MKEVIYIDDIRSIFLRLRDIFIEKQQFLNELDMKTGDGDHGRSMAKGFGAVAEHIERSQPTKLATLFMESAMCFNEAAGSTIGIIIFSALRAMGKVLADRDSVTVQDIPPLLRSAIEAIEKRGKAQRGDKTILDSLYPFLDALEAGLATDRGTEESLRDARQACEAGVEQTRHMIAKIGRSQWFSDRNEGAVDPGAFSGKLMLDAVVDYFTGSQQ